MLPRTIFKFCILSFLLILFSGCAHRTEVRALRTPYSSIDLNDTPLVKQTLYAQLQQWEGTEYRYGGLDRYGVDCSGFVYLTFRNRFGILLPRTTDGQIEVGRDVTGHRLLPGDLLFFSTGLYDRHVGIYLEKRHFIHVSKMRGVMLSDLDDQYWQSKFQAAKRIRPN